MENKYCGKIEENMKSLQFKLKEFSVEIDRYRTGGDRGRLKILKNEIRALMDLCQADKELIADEGRYHYDTRNEIAKAIGCKYVSNFDEGIAMIIREGGYDFVNEEGTLLTDEKFRDIGGSHEGLFRGQKNGKWFYYDQKGKKKIFNQSGFDWASNFNNSIAAVKEGQEYYFITKGGRKLFQKSFFDAHSFSEGAAAVAEGAPVYTEGSKSYHIDENSKPLYEKRFYRVWDFHDGVARVEIKNDEGQKRFHYINKKGEILNKEFFDGFSEAEDCHEGMIRVKLREWHYFDKEFHNRISTSPIGWDKAKDFHEGLAVVQKRSGEKVYFINKYAEKVTGNYEHAYDYHDGRAAVEIVEGQWTFIDEDQSPFMLDKYGTFAEVYSFVDGVARVKKNKIDKTETCINRRGEPMFV